MTSVRDLEKERGKAQLSHSGAIRKLKKLCNVERPNCRAVKLALETVVAEYDKLTDCHVAYVMKSGTTLENPANTTWINTREDEHEVAVEAAEVVLGNLELEGDVMVPVIPPGPDVGELRDEFEIAKIRWESIVSQLSISVEKEINIEQHVALETSAKELQKGVMIDTRKLCKEIQDATSDVTEKAAEKALHNGFLSGTIPKIENILVQLSARKPAARGPEVRTTTAPGSESSRAERSTGGGHIRGSKVKMQALPVPKFDGRIRNYARFKLKFDELVTSQYDQQAQLEFLEQALPKSVINKLSMVQKSPEQMWAQLDTIFNDPKILIK